MNTSPLRPLILEPDNKALLQPFFRTDALLAFDYDGTLAPLVDRASQAVMRAVTRDLLIAVANRYPTVVISGRARHDVLQFLHGVPLLDVVGDHGFEVYGVPPPQLLNRVQEWHRLLEQRLATIEGVSVENKRYSLSVHFRASPDPEAAAKAVHRAASDLDEVRLLGGKSVLNVTLAVAPHKGIALQRLRSRLGDPPAVYVGDDDTDEDVFALPPDPRLLCIRVGSSEKSLAPFRLVDQFEIDELLRAFLEGARGRAAGSSA
ncbi:MAG: trehalose-phosphatase [Ferrovibrio sp.]|uniref:trehalose-phosphatase n=1 Tax=Ferrovibrio sp. TaxID=1917215 RepID=UPI0026217D4F|nr:trehalose-phosphatase [Ferrovibrio sp.]MCW0235750.1 trehalose-phosphatase [Ferrovibrio sp.]